MQATYAYEQSDYVLRQTVAHRHKYHARLRLDQRTRKNIYKRIMAPPVTLTHTHLCTLQAHLSS